MARRWPESRGDVTPRRRPQQNREAESKLRRGGRNCPVCLEALPHVSGKGRVARRCASCEAQLQAGKRCSKCQQEAIWETDAKAACQACGQHGSKLRVIAGALDESEGPEGGRG